MQIAADYLAEKGIGMIHSVSGVGYTMDLDVDMENWFAKGLSNGMQMRVYIAWFEGMEKEAEMFRQRMDLLKSV